MDEIAEFREYLSSKKNSPNTIRQYSHILRNLEEWLGTPLSRATPRNLEKYVHYLALDKCYSKNSLYLAIKCIQGFYRFKKLNVAENLHDFES